MSQNLIARLFKELFFIKENNKELLRAQYQAFQKQMPLLYVILAINTAIIGFSFRHVAPVVLSVYIPLGLCLICAARLAMWLRRRKVEASDAAVLRHLRMTNKLSVVISVVFSSWAFSLYPYGDAYMQGHVAFYMALTEIACIFCLMHLRSAALITTVLVLVPFCGFFFFKGIPSFSAIAVNLALVCGAMIVILFIYYRDFANLVESRKSLIAKQVETQRLSDENFRIANLDSLTNLPNRRSFFADLAKHKTDADQTAENFAIAIIDLDGFKPVNDTYGHSIGDFILIETANRMRGLCAGNACFARLGGDEFALYIGGSPSDEALTKLGNDISRVIRLPYTTAVSTVSISCSIGFAKYSDAQQSLQMLYERADYALYCAKRDIKGGVVLFGPEHETQIQDSRVIEQTLKNADLNTELSLAFQPIVDARTGEAVSFEALARWTSPCLGSVSPAKFIPASERIGLVGQITQILLKRALDVATGWPAPLRLSFNLSVQDICSAQSVLQIIAIVNRSGFDPKRIDFEMTETAMAHDFNQAIAGVVALKALGTGISLDDFGTGFSSLSHLHRLPLDKVKVDKSFVDDIETNPASFKIVKSLMALCADMDLRCIVEGVETAQQEAILLKLGCHYIQGYYFARPLSPEKAREFIDQHRPAPTAIGLPG